MNVLICESNTVFRKMIIFRLKMAGHKAIALTNAEDTIKYLKKETPDLLIADELVPLADGTTLISYMSRHGKNNFPIIVLSDSKVKRAINTTDKVKVGDIIPKPFSPEELIGRINKLMVQ